MATKSPLGAPPQRVASRLVKPQVHAKKAPPVSCNQEPDGYTPTTTMQRISSAQRQDQGGDARIEIPQSNNGSSLSAQETPRGRIVVLRKCDDVHIRTGGFQTIEEQSWRPRDLRRSRPSTADSAYSPRPS